MDVLVKEGGVVHLDDVLRWSKRPSSDVDSAVEDFTKYLEENHVNDVKSLDFLTRYQNEKNVSDRGILALVTIMRSGLLRSLEVLVLGYNHVDDKGVLALVTTIHSGYLPNLHTLNLAANNVGDIGAVALAELIQSGQLNTLRHFLLGGYFGDIGIEAFSKMLQSSISSKLRTLSLYGQQMSDAGLMTLSESLQSNHLTNLEVLHILGNTVGNVGTMALGKALQSIHLSNLQTLQLSFDGGVEGASSLAKSLQSSHLTSLRTLFFHIGYEGAEALVEQLPSNLPKLQELSLTINPGPIDYTVPVISATMLQSGSGKGLEKLWFCSSRNDGRSTKAAGVILAELFESGRLTHLQGLSLQDNQVGIEGAKAVAKLLRSAHVSNLRTLYLGNTGIGNAGAIILAKAFESSQASNLRGLFLSRNGITDEGVEALAESFQSGKFENLEQLELSKNGFGDAGAKALAVPLQSGHLRSLQKLWLQNNGIEDAGLVALAKAFRSGHSMKLEIVSVHSTPTRFKKDGIVEIARLLETSNIYLPRLQKMRLFWMEQKGFDAGLSQAAKDALSRAYTGNAFLTARCCGNSPGWTLGSWDNVATDASFWRTIFDLQWRNEGRVATIKALEGEEAMAGRHAKVFLCGDPGVGKTTLRKALVQQRTRQALPWMHASGSSEAQEPTRGIEVSNVKGMKASGTVPVTLAVWDLAGQLEYQVLHSAFMPDLALGDGEATFFVIVCRTPQRRDDLLWQKHILHWLRFISSNSEAERQWDLRRRVFVVLNCFDGNQSNYVAQKWTKFLAECRKQFEQFLNMHPDPIVLNAKGSKRVKLFKDRLMDEAEVVLQKKKIPKICSHLQEMCRQWADDHQSYPVLQWEEYSNHIGRGWCSEEKFKAATAYLHEVGHIIVFREGWEETGGVEAEGGKALVIVDPQWFCQKVVGQLLLPEDLLKDGESGLKTLMADDGSLRLTTTTLKMLNVPAGKREEVIRIMSRLGLCYQLSGDKEDDKIFVPALIRENYDDLAGWHSTMPLGCNFGPEGWVMGFSLVLREELWWTTLLPIALFRRLQVDLAQDESVGNRADSRYSAGVSRVSLRYRGMDVLVEYSSDFMNSKRDRIDVLVNPGANLGSSSFLSTRNGDNVERPQQVNLAQVIVDKILDIRKACCPGVDLEKRIIKPWRSGEGVIRMIDRDIGMKAEDLIVRITKEGAHSTNWTVKGVSVEGEDLLSDKDLQRVYYSAESKYNLISMAVEKMGLFVSSPNWGDSVPSQPFGSQSSSEVHIEVEPIELNPQTTLILNQFHSRFNRIDEKLDYLAHDLKDVKGSLHKLLGQQKALICNVQSLEAFSVMERERSVPRFAYLAKPWKPKSWLRIRQAFVEPFTLHFLCEAPHASHTLHEVDLQKGVDVAKVKDWAKKLVPILEWTLKIAFVLVSVAGTAVIPGLGIFIPTIPDGILSSEAQLTNGIANLLQNSSAKLSSARDRQLRVGALGQSNGGGGGDPNELEMRGAARAAVKEVLQGLNSQEFEQQVALRRVRLSDTFGGLDQDGILGILISARYANLESFVGSELEEFEGNDFEALEQYAFEWGESTPTSGSQERSLPN